MIANGSFWFMAALAAVFIGIFLIVVVKIMQNRINLDNLLSEPDGKASLARFQLLLFTFVVAGLFMILSLEAGQFIEIPSGVQGLLGISGGSYILSKVISSTTKKPDGAQPAAAAPQPAPGAAANG
jgi:hypothetical protein